MISKQENIIYGGDFEEPNCNSLGELIIDILRKRKNDVILINGVTNAQWTAWDILEFSFKIAKALRAAGVKRNDIVAIAIENRFEFMGIAFGTFMLNACLAPVNYTYAKNDLKHGLNLSKPKLIFTSSNAVKNIIDISKDLNCIEKIILLDINHDLNSKIPIILLRDFINIGDGNNFKIQNIKVDLREQTALIMLSSGTTGLTKAVELSQYNLAASIRAFELRFESFYRFTNKIISLNFAPWFHIMGFIHTYGAILSTKLFSVFLPRYDQRQFLSTIERYKIVSTNVAPPVMVFLSKDPIVDQYDISSLRIIFCGGAPLKEQTEVSIKERFKGRLNIIQGYGLTETTAGMISGDIDLKPAFGTSGVVAPGSYVKIIDKNGNSLGPNKVGEICCKGSKVMKGYLNDPKATNETIDKDGWLKTGDLGYYDEDLQFFIVDRLKELIKYKGFQVPPAELEGLLLSNPKVKDCGVIGIPDEVSGELPMAFVVKQDNVELTEKEIKDFVSKNASNAKWLRGGVKFIDEIPKNPSGKILRRELRDLYKNSKPKL